LNIIRNSEETGIYVHFPYCIQKCSYCDFYSVGLDQTTGGKEPPVSAFLEFRDSVQTEFRKRIQNFATKKVRSVYFGGGTSSLLPPEIVAGLIEQFKKEMDFKTDCEITLEGNPENFTSAYLSALKDAGVNRINAGLQTFNRSSLEAMNRYFDPERYASILRDLTSCEIKNTGGDLIYGFPGQTEEEFFADLQAAATSGISHLSVYSLTVEENTPYAKQARTGERKIPDEDLQRHIFEILPGHLLPFGFKMYEISNYSRGGRDCRHNLGYWLYEPYMGLGPGAHGFDGSFRWANPRNIAQYQRDPASTGKEKEDLAWDMPLGLFRITEPIQPQWLYEIFSERGINPDRLLALEKLLAAFVEEGSGIRTGPSKGGTFQWTMAGLLMLDNHILRISEAIEQDLQVQAV